MIKRRTVLKLLGGALLTALAAPVYAFTEVLGRPTITRYSLVPPRWPEGLRLSVAVIADVHACDPWMSLDRVSSIVDQTNALGADLILLMGDYLGTTRFVTGRVSVPKVAASLAPLEARLGVYAVLGNHDYWDDRDFQKNPKLEPEMALALQSVGIRTLINTSLRLRKDGHSVWLAGLGDQMALLPGKAYGRKKLTGLHDVDSTFRGIPSSDPVLLMAHEPDIFRRMDDRPSLTISGHTHGGQIDILGWRPVSASSGSRRYPAGHFEEGGRHLIVSKGLGITGLPFRVGCWPEILLLDLGKTSE